MKNELAKEDISRIKRLSMLIQINKHMNEIYKHQAEILKIENKLQEQNRGKK